MTCWSKQKSQIGYKSEIVTFTAVTMEYYDAIKDLLLNNENIIVEPQ